MPCFMSEKLSLRRRIRQHRAVLDAREQRRAARAVARRLASLRRFQRARAIAAYCARQGEMDPQPALHAARLRGKDLYLPVLHPFFPGRLKFCELREHTRMRPNRFGIPEPSVNTDCVKHSHRLDLMLVPLVAFDRHGHRLGMGGGYYDRSLGFRHRSNRIRPLLIGLAYEFQFVERLPHEPWDIMLDAVVTERRIHRFNRVVA